MSNKLIKPKDQEAKIRKKKKIWKLCAALSGSSSCLICFHLDKGSNNLCKISKAAGTNGFGQRLFYRGCCNQEKGHRYLFQW